MIKLTVTKSKKKYFFRMEYLQNPDFKTQKVVKIYEKGFGKYYRFVLNIYIS